MTPKCYRNLFEGIEIPVALANGSYKVPINFDNGATTPPFRVVNEAIKESIEMYGAIHRGGQKALYSTECYEQAKRLVLQFLGLSPKDGYCVIYVKNTTEGLNLLANELCNRPGMKVLSTRLEHHANDLPWRKNAMMFYIEVDEDGRLKEHELEEKLKFARGSIQYVTLAGASNVTGYVTPIHEVAKIVHRYGAKLIVDAAQLVAHRQITMKGKSPEEAIDFLVFSAHKMYAPFGTGVVVAKEEALCQSAPYLLGGGAVEAVFDQDVYFKQSPDKEEAGTPNYLGVMALAAGIEQLQQIGMEKVANHEEQLKKRLLEGLRCIPKIELYGDSTYKDRLGVAVFNIQGIHHSQVNDLLAGVGGIAVRNGCFCAHPYVARLLGISEYERYQMMLDPNSPSIGMVRASLGLYNTLEEIDAFLEVMEWIGKVKASEFRSIRTYKNKKSSKLF